MSFLHGVLSGVRDDDNVTTYDKNNVPNITKVITTLHDNVGKGRQAFEEAVRQVDQKTSEVKSKLGKYYNQVYDKTDLNGQLHEWRGTLGNILVDLRKIETDNINLLDSALKSRIMHETKPIQKSVEVLLNSASDPGLEGHVKYVDNTLVERNQKLVDAVNEEIEKLREMLDSQLLKIWDGVESLRNTKSGYFEGIKKTLQAMQSFVDNEFGDNYNSFKLTIVNYFNDIKAEVYRAHARLAAKKDELTELVGSAQRSVVALKDKVVDAGGTTGEIHTNWPQLKKTITGLVADLAGDAERTKRGNLKKIIDEVKKYAEKFKHEGSEYTGMRGILRGWIQKILQSKPVTGSLATAVAIINGDPNKRTPFMFPMDSVDKVAKQIAAALSTEITTAQSSIGDVQSGVNSMEQNVNLINTVCNNFAKQLEQKIESSNFDNIVNAIKNDVKTSRINNNESHLRGPARLILYQLLGIAKQVGAEVHQFTVSESELNNNVRLAIGKVEEIGEQVDDKSSSGKYTQGLGNKIDEALSVVQLKVGELDGLLGDKLNAAGSIQDKLGEMQTEVITELDRLQKDDASTGGSVEMYKAKATREMETLRNKLSYSIDLTRREVAAADKALDVSISALQTTVESAAKEAQNARENLRDTLLQNIETAFLLLTNQMRAMFCAQHQADLTALATLAETQKSSIEKIIATDRITGLKGLLQKLRANYIPHVDKIDQNSKFNFAASSVHAAFIDFSRQLNKQSDITDHAPQINALHASLDDVFDKLLHHQHFHHAVSTAREAFEASLQAFKADTFPDAPKKVLQPLKQGLEKFAQELEKQYVSRYSGMAERFEWTQSVGDPQTQKQEPTEDAKKCAKVFMTCVQTLLDNLSELKDNCTNGGSWGKKQINRTTHLGNFLQSVGYGVATSDKNQNGELRNYSKMRGLQIHEKLAAIICIDSSTHVPQCKPKGKDSNFDIIDFIECIMQHVHEYYRVCHHSTLSSTKHPTTVNQMLRWLSGLTYNPIYDALTLDGFEELLKQYQEKDSDTPVAADKAEGEEGPTFAVLNDLSLEAYPHKITVDKLTDNLLEVCQYSHGVLVAILGNGHEDGTYACDYNANSDKLMYPSIPGACIQMFTEVLCRVHHQLYFLFNQCYYTTQYGGWRDCWYGKGVAGSGWQCNEMQCPGQAGDQKADQMHNQTCSQKCNQTVECGLKSPLQSFLEDGLQGFLPHTLTKLGCGAECSVGKHRGLPCKTPMGFNNIGTLASRSRTGEHIKNVLHEFCGKSYKPLSQMCNYLVCLLPSAPTTLGDMFGFYYNLLKDPSKSKEHRIDAFNKAVTSANFEEPTTLDITPLFGNSNHVIPKPQEQKNSHVTGDLYSLVECKKNSKSTVGHPCGPYLRPLCRDVCVTFSVKHAAKYLSWVVYTTETFHSLLKKLYEECNGNCGDEQPKCRVTKCSKECGTMKAPQSPESKHNESCGSIVKCQYTLPTLFKYGFVHENIEILSDNSSKRTCKDLCTALHNVINEKENVKAALAELIFRTIPDYLCKIRWPFMTTLLALWSLSLLYLLHIAVVRLDVLRIRSHLRSPSSHRIAAQSLLAAARVKALANVKYFSP
ncbi:hypothetical protein, conserved [Babesia ovata]|uniref:C3H1-type domain-containing protein n=1 Tax=Babesia ovata TaxID=189622 RepID=A0A2H6KJU1_9APIC|nr:uncharacterized protein BOVATA_047500 [Babesia ovata]GBE63257.1 hypothetical protein, conserved [Babesia ovata]